VVERPASVVKELVENALDAGAGRIRVEAREGGSAWIAVTDDGCGMSPADARLALQRHATSKLAAVEDLARIASFGFRGEALPAIASVSRLRLLTRARDADEAVEIRMEGGRTLSEHSAGGAVGTRVEVAQLFANVPARRKFLKRPSTEWGHVAEWLSRCALALPEVHFEVRRDQRPALVWPAASDRLDRIAAVLSEEQAGALLRVESAQGELGLEAFVSAPEHSRPTAAGLHLFVNGRAVRDRLLRHAILEVYRDLLPRGRFPTALLFLRLPPAAVDVNVHPAKWEVRFASPQQVHALVRGALREAIASRRWLGGAPAAPLAGVREQTGQGGAPASDWIFAKPIAPPGDGGRGDASLARDAAGSPPERAPAPRLRFAELRLLGQLLASYLLVEAKEGLLLVDQHAAHERVLYERLRAEWIERGVEQQGLLAPEIVELEPRAAATLAEEGERIARLGFDAEPFGESSAVLRAIPAVLAGRDPRALLRELTHELSASASAGEGGAADLRLLAAADRVFATLACHAARRAGDALDPREQQALLEALDGIPWAPTCPHGRPVAVAVDLAEIERRFGRR
jgi:DNA mismatch repair protein MutL